MAVMIVMADRDSDVLEHAGSQQQFALPVAELCSPASSSALNI